MLSGQHRERRMAGQKTFLDCYRQDRDVLFSHILVDDEMWISYTNGETKQQSIQWHHLTEKIQAISLFEYENNGYHLLRRKGHSFGWFHRMQNCSWQLQQNACRTEICNPRSIWHGKLQSGIVLLQDNGQPHATAQTRKKKILVGNFLVIQSTVLTLHLPTTSSSCTWNSGLVENSLRTVRKSKPPLWSSSGHWQQTSMEMD